MKTKNSFMKAVLMSFAMYAFMTLLMTEKTSAQTVSLIEKPVCNVTFLNTENEYLVFQITINQPQEKKGLLKVYDKYKENIYTETVRTKDFTLRLKMPIENAESIEFSFFSGKDVFRKSYQVIHMIKETIRINDVTTEE